MLLGKCSDDRGGDYIRGAADGEPMSRSEGSVMSELLTSGNGSLLRPLQRWRLQARPRIMRFADIHQKFRQFDFGQYSSHNQCGDNVAEERKVEPYLEREHR